MLYYCNVHDSHMKCENLGKFLQKKSNIIFSCENLGKFLKKSYIIFDEVFVEMWEQTCISSFSVRMLIRFELCSW